MKNRLLILVLASLATAGMTLSTHAANPVLPADAALSLDADVDPGLVVRTVQAPTNSPVANSFVRAFRQLNGTLRDSANVLIPNEAIPGPGPDGSFVATNLSYELNGLPVHFFSSELFPGIPGANGQTDYFATEAVTYLELYAGTYVFGMSVAADRTDVNDDDGYVVFCGSNPRSYFNVKVGEYQRFAAPFASNQQNTNYFAVDVPVDGLYPFRVVHWQTTRSANLTFFSYDPNTGNHYLINDQNNPFDSVRAFRSVTNARPNGPYVAEVSPLPDSSGIASDVPIEVLLVDGALPINGAQLKLYLNNVRVTPQSVIRSGSKLAVRYTPSATRPDVNNLIRVEFEDTAGLKDTNSWQFTIVATGAPKTAVTGQWDFEFCDLSATVGFPLQYFDGPTGLTATGTKFGTCTSLGVPLINGEDAKIMESPYDAGAFAPYGYIMQHGIAPNGGGTRVNQFTLIMDILVDTTGSPGAASLLQMSPGNNDDGDLFWQGSNFGQGTGGYNGAGTFTASEWHRVAIAYDEAANPPFAAKYVDGVKQDDWTAGHALDNVRRSLAPTAVLFGDADGDNERRRMWVNSIQIRAGKLSDAELAALGGPSSGGIPSVIPETTVTGQWDFNVNIASMNGQLAPTVGKGLDYFDGPTGVTAAGTRFGTCSELSVALINGEEANIMEAPYDAGVFAPYGYTMTHLIPPNGGGTRVNQFTLIMDVLVDTTGSPGAASLLQMNPANTDDGDLFWQGDNFGQGTAGYNGAGTFTAGEWHRVAIAYDEAANPPFAAKYVDGVKQDDWTGGHALDNVRRSLAPTAVLFGDADGDNERRRMWLNSVQIRAGRLSDAEIAALGKPSAKGIPVIAPKSTVSGQWDFDVNNTFLNGRLTPTVGKALNYFDGPTGVTATETRFGTCTELGVSLINGADATIMEAPYNSGVFAPYGYTLTHLIPPNGGGTRVNQFTLIMDVLVDTTGSPGAASLLQMNPANTDDGDLFWQGDNFGQGTDGYGGTGIFTAGEWHRVAIAYDEAANPPHAIKYVDGIFQQDWTAGHLLDGPRRSLAPTAVLFGDADGDNERRKIWVNSVQIRAGALSQAELAALGTPTGEGIPVAITLPAVPVPRLTIVRSASNARIAWPANVTGYRLQGTASLTDPVWEDVPSQDNCATVAIPIAGGAQFFRLINP